MNRQSGTPRLTVLLLGTLSFLAAVGPFATDMYLASFTDIARDLGAHSSQVQLTLTAFLLGMGAGQLLLGPLSDQLGRKPVLAWGMTVFAVSGILMTFSPNIEVFIGLRAVQGLTGAAGVVVSRAIAVDIAKGAAAIRAISLIAMFVGLGPLLAPPLGGAVLQLGDWRTVLAVLAGISTLMAFAAWIIVPESLPRSARVQSGIATSVSHFGALVRNPSFILLMVSFGLGFGAMMAYISASPFVGQNVLGMSPLVYSLAFALGATAMILGNVSNARLAGRVPARVMLLLGAASAVVAGLVLTLACVFGFLSPWLFVGCAFVLTGGTGIVMSNSSALALGLAEHARGSGSALLGAMQFTAGGVASPIVGAWGEGTALPMSVFVLCAAGVSCAAALLYFVRGRS